MISFRPPTIEHLALLKYWDQQPHLLASAANVESEWEDLNHYFDWSEQFIAMLDDNFVGFVQISDPAMEESQYWGDVPENLWAIHIWIGEERSLSKGYGTKMMIRK